MTDDDEFDLFADEQPGALRNSRGVTIE